MQGAVPSTVVAGVNELVTEYSGDGDAVIFTDGLVAHHMWCAWAFSAQYNC